MVILQIASDIHRQGISTNKVPQLRGTLADNNLKFIALATWLKNQNGSRESKSVILMD